MFSGIIESLGSVQHIESKGTNKIFTISHSYGEELYIDQSISHNGVCLTIVRIGDDSYIVEAVQETLDRSNLKYIKVGDSINLERSILPTTRMDGHMVQGHVDGMAEMLSTKDLDGSWEFSFQLSDKTDLLVIEKGSITINGISLTVMSIKDRVVTVAIIPYTYENTNLKSLILGSIVNIEFDIVGKYVINYMEMLGRNEHYFE